MSADARAVEQLFQQALALHRGGQDGLAESHYRRVVKLAPRHADAWHLLGILALSQGKSALAVKHLRSAIEARPDFSQAWNNLALAHKSRNDFEAAVGAAQHALALRPDYAEAAFNLGLIHASCGDTQAAEAAYRNSLRINPDNTGALANLGNLLRSQARIVEAAPLLERALALREDADSLANAALLRIDQGRFADARDLSARVLSADPASATAWQALGIAARLEHDAQAAVFALRKALQLAPDDVTAQIELALALQDTGEYAEARQRLTALAKRWPESTRLRWLAGLVLPAIPDSPEMAQRSRLDFEAGLERIERETSLRHPMQVAAALEAASSVVPFHLHYQAQDGSGLQRRFGALVSRCVAAAAPELASACDWSARAHSGRLRVGFVSPHLYAHSVARFFGSLITGLDRTRFERFVWHTGEAADDTSAALAAAVDHFEQRYAPPLEIARSIRSAELDVLVFVDVGLDPAMQVLGSLRLAPVQCAAYGHPVTTGLAQVDYFLSGELLDGPDAQGDYSEKLVRLPGIGAQPQRPPTGGDGAWLGAIASDLPWALCLQNPLKLTPDFDDVLIEILVSHDVRIGVFDVSPPITARWHARVVQRLAGRDPAARARLHLFPPVSHADLVAGISHAALVLDSPHFSGGSTSLDAIAAATPVVAFRGSRLRANQTSAMLQIVGAPELIANDAAQYVRIVKRLLSDRDERARLSAVIRGGAGKLFENRAPVEAFGKFLVDAVQRLAEEKTAVANP